MMRAWAAAGLLLAGSCAGGAAPGDDPAPFVVTLYARYVADPNFFVSPLSAVSYEAVYSPSFMAVLNANFEFHAKHEDMSFDGDPLCDCQEHDSMTTPQIVVRRTGRASAEATANFIIEDTYVRSITLKLVQTPAGWRVDDVGESGWTVDDPGKPDIIPSLRASLIKDMNPNAESSWRHGPG